jgi:hypothetical protein
MTRQSHQSVDSDSVRELKNKIASELTALQSNLVSLSTLDSNVKLQLSIQLASFIAPIKSGQNSLSTIATVVNDKLKAIRDSLPVRFENLTSTTKENHRKVEDMFTTAINRIDEIRRSNLPNRIGYLLENRSRLSQTSHSEDSTNKENESNTPKKN